MPDPGGAKKVRFSVQEVLSRSFDYANNAIKMSATLEASDIQIGAVEIKNHDTGDRAYVDPEHYQHVRSQTLLDQTLSYTGESFNGTDDPMPTSPSTLVLSIPAGTIRSSFIANDEPVIGGKTLEYSIDGGVSWQKIKPQESRSIEDARLAIIILKSSDGTGAEAYRADVLGS